MKIQAFTLHNPKHHANLFNWPEEDSFKFSLEKDKIIIAVADGITRDPLGSPTLPDYHTLSGEIEFALEYPIPSPARAAADLFCKTFVKRAKNSNNTKNLFNKANKKIKSLNKNLKIDYLENDFAACVASAGIIRNNILSYGYITDCGIAIFKKNGKLKFKTKNEKPNPKISNEIAKEPKKYGKDWSDPKFRVRTRSHYRNNPKEKLSYGALTGENTSLFFLRTGKVKLTKGEYIIFHSDGFTPIILNKRFNIRKNFKNLKNYAEKMANKISGSEGTLVALQL
jgi:serine/threonine protein phosphatase PrpC